MMNQVNLNHHLVLINHYGSYFLLITPLEIFGTLYLCNVYLRPATLCPPKNASPFRLSLHFSFRPFRILPGLVSLIVSCHSPRYSADMYSNPPSRGRNGRVIRIQSYHLRDFSTGDSLWLYLVQGAGIRLGSAIASPAAICSPFGLVIVRSPNNPVRLSRWPAFPTRDDPKDKVTSIDVLKSQSMIEDEEKLRIS